jgi:hypothetical protein
MLQRFVRKRNFSLRDLQHLGLVQILEGDRLMPSSHPSATLAQGDRVEPSGESGRVPQLMQVFVGLYEGLLSYILSVGEVSDAM